MAILIKRYANRKLYNPETPTADRLLRPQLRVGNDLVPISWDDALDLVAACADGGPEPTEIVELGTRGLGDAVEEGLGEHAEGHGARVHGEKRMARRVSSDAS